MVRIWMAKTQLLVKIITRVARCAIKVGHKYYYDLYTIVVIKVWWFSVSWLPLFDVNNNRDLSSSKPSDKSLVYCHYWLVGPFGGRRGQQSTKIWVKKITGEVIYPNCASSKEHNRINSGNSVTENIPGPRLLLTFEHPLKLSQLDDVLGRNLKKPQNRSTYGKM